MRFVVLMYIDEGIFFRKLCERRKFIEFTEVHAPSAVELLRVSFINLVASDVCAHDRAVPPPRVYMNWSVSDCLVEQCPVPVKGR